MATIHQILSSESQINVRIKTLWQTTKAPEEKIFTLT